MWKSHELFNIHTTIEDLSTKFHELDSSYFSFLQKSYRENQRILEQESNLTSEFYHNLLQEQTVYETNISQLSSMRQLYDDQVAQLKSFFAFKGEDSSKHGGYSEHLSVYSNYLNSKLVSLKTKVLTVPQLDSLGQDIVEQVDIYFQETVQDLNATFPQFSELIKEHNAENWGKKRIEKVLNANIPSFIGLEKSVNAIKTTMARSLAEFDNFAISYNKESSVLKDSLEQIKLQVSRLAREAKSESLKPTSPGTRGRNFNIDDSPLSQQTRMTCNTISQLLTDSFSAEQTKNRYVSSIREEIKGLREEIKQQLIEVARNLNIVKESDQKINSILGGDDDNKERRSRSAHDEEHFDSNNRLKYSSKPKSNLTLAEKRKTFLSPERSPLSTPLGSPLQNFLIQSKSPLDTFSGPFMQKIDEKLANLGEVDSESLFRAFGQKLVNLESSIKNIIISSGKVASLFVNFSDEEELALRIYESDKQSVENNLNNFKSFVLQSLENAKSAQLKKSVSNDILINRFFNSDATKSPSKTTTDKEQRRSSPTFKSEGKKSKSPGLHEVAYTDNSGRGPSKLKDLESPVFVTNFSEEARPSSELTSLKAKYRDLSNENQRINELKGKTVPKDLVKKVEDLSSQKENLSKENLQLLKVIKKLHRKAEDRKKNLKQLFELMTEKEKEIEQYKRGKKAGPNVEAEKEKVIESLNLQIKQKETELKNLEETVSKKLTKDSSQEFKSQPRGHKGLLTEHVMELERRKQKLEEVLANLPSEANSEIDEVKEMISLLDKEKDEALKKQRGIVVTNSPNNKRKTISKRQTEEEEEDVVQTLELEKKQLEDKCQDLMNDIESLQEHKKRIERNYKDEVRLMNTKVQELNDYIHELELKNTQRLKGSLGSEKWGEFKEENQKSTKGNPAVLTDLRNIIETLKSEGHVDRERYKKIKGLIDNVFATSTEVSPSTLSAKDNLKDERDLLMKEKLEFQGVINSLREELEETAIANQDILLEVERLKKDVNNYKAKFTNSENEKNKLTREIQHVKMYLESHSRELIESGHVSVENEKSAIIKDLNRVLKELESRGKTISTLTDEIAEKTMRIEALEGTVIPSKEKTIEGLHLQLKESKDRLLILQKTILIEQGKDSVQTSPKEVQNLQKQVYEKQSQVEQLEDNILQLNSELKNKESMIALFEENVIPQKEKIISDLKELLGKKQDLITSKEEALHNKQNDFDKELVRINEKLVTVNQHLGQVQQQNKLAIKEKKELESSLQESQQEVQALKSSLEEAKAEIERLTQDLMNSREVIVQETHFEEQHQEEERMKRASPQKHRANDFEGLVEQVKEDLTRAKFQERNVFVKLDQIKTIGLNEKEQGLLKQQEIEDQLRQVVQEKDTITSELSNLRQQIEEIQELKKQQLAEYEEKLEEAVSNSQLLQRELENTKKHFETIQSQKEGQEMSLLQEAREQVFQKENEILKYQNDIEKLNHKVQSLNTKVHDLENIFDKLKQKLADEENSSAVKQKHISEYRELNEMLERKNNDLIKRVQTSELDLANSKDLHSSETLTLKTKFEKESNDLKAEIKALQDSKTKLIEAKTQEISSHTVNIEHLKKTTELLKEDLVREKSKREDVEAKLARELQNAEQGIELNKRAAMTQEEQLKNKIQELEQENQRLTDRLNDLNLDFENSQSHFEKFTQELRLKIEEQQKEFETNLQEKLNENAALEAKLREHQDSANEKDLGVAKLKSQHLEAIQEKDEKIRALESDLRTVGQDLDHVVQAEEQHQHKIQLLRAQFEEKKSELHQELENKNQEIQDLTAQLERKTFELSALEKELNDARNQVQTLESQLLDVQSELSKQRDESQQLTEKLAGAEKEQQEFKVQIENLNGLSSQRDETIQSLNLRVSQLDQECAHLRKDYDDLTVQRDTFVHKLEKIGNQKEDLDVKYRTLKEEKRSLNEVINQLKQSVASLKNTQSSSEQKLTEEMLQRDQVIGAFAQSFQDLEKNGYLTGITNFTFDDKTQVEEVMGVLRNNFNNQKELAQKNQQEFQKTMQAMNENLAKQHQDASTSKQEIDSRIKKLYSEIEAVFTQNCVVEKPETPVGDELSEDRINLYFTVIRNNLEAFKSLRTEHTQLVNQYDEKGRQVDNLMKEIILFQTSKKNLEEENEKLVQEGKAKVNNFENLQQGLESELEKAKKNLDEMKKVYGQRETEITELKTQIASKRYFEKPSDFDIPEFELVEDELGEEKIKSLMEDTFKVERRAEEQQYLTPLNEEIRELKDENEKLDIEYRQLRSQHELLQGCNEELKTEINEKEEEVKKMEYQMAVLKEEFAKMEREKNQTTIAHEKQHIRMMFIKFMESALQGSKEGPELLKCLLGLLDLPESNRAQIIEGFKSKTNKKSSFKVFN